jgi:Major Facilitator Superfamily
MTNAGVTQAADARVGTHAHVDSEARTRRARFAVAAVFFVNGALFANWVVRVPAVKDGIGAGTGALGLALLGLAVGSLVSMPLAGRVCARIGSDRAVVVSGLAASLALSGPALAASAPALGLALAAYGAAFGLLDVAMNVQAVAVVRRVGRPIMPWFHAAFSLGGLAGAATGALAAEVGLSPLVHFLLAGAAAAGVILVARGQLVPDGTAGHAPERSGPTQPTRPSRPVPWLILAGLGAVAGCAALGEGAMADWTALFLRDVTGAGAGVAALGFAAFSITMTAGRLGGEAAIRRLGPVRVLQLGGAAATVGIVLAVATAWPLSGLAGFALVGLGFSCAFPVALTTAGELSDGSGGSEIATVSVIGYLGFLIGPPLIGLLAEAVELRAALLAIAAPTLGLVALADVVGQKPPPSTASDLPTSVTGHCLSGWRIRGVRRSASCSTHPPGCAATSPREAQALVRRSGSTRAMLAGTSHCDTRAAP